MNRLVAFGMLGLLVFCAHGACQSPDFFHRVEDAAGPTGSGGRIGSLGGSPGAGGRTGTGGAVGIGGATGTGGRTGAGGAIGAGGRVGSGGTIGSGGTTGAGGMIGAGGMTGAGGGMVPDGGGLGGAGGGNGCISAIQAAGYTAGTASCSGCLDHSTSINDQCVRMIDCLGRSPLCSGSCYLTCFNGVGGSNPLTMCMSTMLAGPGCPAP